MTKNCSNKKCKYLNPQPFSNFGKNKSHNDGMQHYCLKCFKEIRSISEKSRPKETAEAKKNWEIKNIEKRRSVNSIWLKSNPAKGAAKTAKRNASKLERTPKWLTREHLEEIENLYSLAKDLQWLSNPNDPLTIDHIVPLQGKNVSGLHVPWNLQILPKSSNSRKWNKF